MLGAFKPSAMMVRQLLLASGIRDPQILSTVDKVLSAGVGAPTVTHMTGSEGVCIPVPEGASCVKAAMQSPGEVIEVYMLVLKRDSPALGP